MNKNYFNNRYIELGPHFYKKTLPTPTLDPQMIIFNTNLASDLGLSDFAPIAPNANNDPSINSTAIFAGNLVPDGAEPLAMAYSGHQFGHFNPQLGDGRAILLGEIDAPNGQSFNLQLKGSGRTFFSRNGDGRSALGPVLREYLVSEAMSKLGVPTTRALAAVATGEKVVRQELLPGGIITRIATSFIRVGTFQYFAAQENIDAIKNLADFVIERNYPQLDTVKTPYVDLFKKIIDRQAALIAKWMQLGFIHGVMNTDNMSIAGETIDYGPCAFMDAYSHDQVYSAIDEGKRYAYNNQPSIGLWNLTRLAEAFLPLLADETETAIEIAQDALSQYPVLYQQYWLANMRNKIGLSSEHKDDKALIEELFHTMAAGNADFTLTFYYLSQLNASPGIQDEKINRLFSEPEELEKWKAKWRERLRDEKNDDTVRQAKMAAVNPVYIPRNHQIEKAIRAAEDNDDFSIFHQLHKILESPYELQQGKESYMLPPEPDEIIRQTFCGT